jgi:glycerol-3-phosphate acyltransferase PlsX
MKKPVVAVDAMGGDHGAAVIVPACLELLSSDPVASLLLVGQPEQILPLLSEAPGTVRARTEVVEASQVVAMDDPPGDALRRKKDSSMRVALNLVKDGRAQAVVSAGNTGALMAISRFVLKTLPGIDRPAIISAIPALGGHTHMLDLGANADCTAEQLVQFAVMGTVVASDIHDIEHPTVGLLNIGTEEIKGSDTLRLAGRMLTQSQLRYVGFVEGHDIMSGTVDVVVTDGFTGNVSLKTMEGAVRMLFETTRGELHDSWLGRMAVLAARPLIRSLQARLDPRLYNGASLVGLQGIVIKSHGSADSFAFQNALRTALVEIEKGVPRQIGELLAKQTVLERAG